MLHHTTHELVASEGFVHKGRSIPKGEVLGTITSHRDDFPADHLINRAYNSNRVEMRIKRNTPAEKPAVESGTKSKSKTSPSSSSASAKDKD